MVQLSWILVAAAAVLSGVTAQGSGYAQCGGNNWTGATTCIAGWHCEKLNEYYSQCLPGGATSTSSSVPTSTSTTSGGSPSTSSTSSAGPAPTAPSTGPGPTLQPDYLWIRAVAAPNFHKYLQSATARTATDAVLDAPASAGQFNVVSGQLVQLIDTAGTKLYGHVQERPDSATMKLKLTWQTTPDTYGTFGFSGDTLTWTHASISRPNTAAFLVCESQRVYINLGPYMYQTPTGCSDQTIHYYNGATADA